MIAVSEGIKGTNGPRLNGRLLKKHEIVVIGCRARIGGIREPGN
jgi:hypothetical protein